MTQCDRCEKEHPDWSTRLRNVYYDDGTIQELRSRMLVCDECFGEMADSPHWDWD